MSPQEKSEAVLKDLCAALRVDVAAARARAAEVVDEIAESAQAMPSRASVALIAVCMDRAYTAIEAGFLRIARTIDDQVPSGEAWHASLVHQMTLPIAHRRAAVIDDALCRALEPLRRHRHWLRHAYAATFEWSRMREAVSAFPATIDAACSALTTLADTLDT